MNLNLFSQTAIGKYIYIAVILALAYLIPIAAYFTTPSITHKVIPALLAFPVLLTPIFFTLKTRCNTTPTPTERRPIICKVILLQFALFALTHQISLFSFQYTNKSFLWDTPNCILWAGLWCLYLCVAVLMKCTRNNNYITLIPNTKSSYNSIFIKRSIIMAYNGNALFAINCYCAFLIIAITTMLLGHFDTELPRNSTNAYVFYLLLMTVIFQPQLNKIYQLCQRYKLNLALYLAALTACIVLLIFLLSAITEIAGTIPSPITFFSFWLPDGYSAFIFGFLACLSPYVGGMLASIFQKASIKEMITISLIFPIILIVISKSLGSFSLPEWLSWIGTISIVLFIAHPRCAIFSSRNKQQKSSKTPLFLIPIYQKRLYQPFLCQITLLVVATLIGSINFVLLATFACGMVSLFIYLILTLLAIGKTIKQAL